MLSHINIGSGLDITVKKLAEEIKDIVGFNGKILFDKSKPDGPLKKLTDITRISNMGWTPNINLTDGLKETYDWYRNHINV
jgi:nucleoside-diphosphate-sugar epimerase